MTPKEASVLQEREIAKMLQGKVQAGSGGTTFGGGDVHTDSFFIEAKTVTLPKLSYPIHQAVIDKMRQQAFEQRKPNCALAFRLEPTGEDFFVIDSRLMKILVQHLEGE